MSFIYLSVTLLKRKGHLSAKQENKKQTKKPGSIFPVRDKSNRVEVSSIFQDVYFQLLVF